MKCKMLVILNILLGFCIFQASLQCMNPAYSYIQGIIDKKEKFIFKPMASDTDVLPKFPSQLIIMDVVFDYKGQFSSAFKDSDDVIVIKMRHVLYAYKIAEHTLLRILISIKLIPDEKSACYTLNVDKYREGKILNAAVVLPEKLKLDASLARLILPVEEITENLKCIVAAFGVDN